MHVTAQENKELRKAVRTAARTAARTAGAKVYKVYSDKRVSNVKSNICGTICKLYVNRANTIVLAAVQKAVAQYNCTAIRTKCIPYNVYIYIQVVRNV